MRAREEGNRACADAALHFPFHSAKLCVRLFFVFALGSRKGGRGKRQEPSGNVVIGTQHEVSYTGTVCNGRSSLGRNSRKNNRGIVKN